MEARERLIRLQAIAERAAVKLADENDGLVFLVVAVEPDPIDSALGTAIGHPAELPLVPGAPERILRAALSSIGNNLPPRAS